MRDRILVAAAISALATSAFLIAFIAVSSTAYAQIDPICFEFASCGVPDVTTGLCPTGVCWAGYFWDCHCLGPWYGGWICPCG